MRNRVRSFKLGFETLEDRNAPVSMLFQSELSGLLPALLNSNLDLLSSDRSQLRSEAAKRSEETSTSGIRVAPDRFSFTPEFSGSTRSPQGSIGSGPVALSNDLDRLSRFVASVPAVPSVLNAVGDRSSIHVHGAETPSWTIASGTPLMSHSMYSLDGYDEEESGDFVGDPQQPPTLELPDVEQFVPINADNDRHAPVTPYTSDRTGIQYGKYYPDNYAYDFR